MVAACAHITVAFHSSGLDRCRVRHPPYDSAVSSSLTVRPARVADPNPRAQAFYRKHGFVADGAAQIEEPPGQLVLAMLALVRRHKDTGLVEDRNNDPQQHDNRRSEDHQNRAHLPDRIDLRLHAEGEQEQSVE